MRRFVTATLLALGGLVLTSDPAEAQNRRYRNIARYSTPSTYYSYYPGTYSNYSSLYGNYSSLYGNYSSPLSTYSSPYGSYSTPYGSAAYGGAWSGAYSPGLPVSPLNSSYSTYANPYMNVTGSPYGYGGYPAAGAAAGPEYIRTLYNQYLGREPDAAGMQAWLNRLAVLNGDTGRLASEFLVSAQQERNANTPGYPTYWGYR